MTIVVPDALSRWDGRRPAIEAAPGAAWALTPAKAQASKAQSL